MNARTWLWGAAGVQVLFAVVAWWPTPATPDGTRALVDLSARQIEALEIVAEPDETPLRVERRGDEWVLPSHADYPADVDKVETLLEDLIALRIDAEPVTRQRVSQIAMNVDDAQFGRRITVQTPNSTSVLFLGGSRGTTLHARRDGDDATYVARGARLAAFPSSAAGLVDTKWVEVDASSLQRLELSNRSGTLVFERSDDAWQLQSPAVEDAAALDAAAIERLISRATDVRLREPSAAAADTVDAEVEVRWTTTDGEHGGFSLGAEQGGMRLGVRSDGRHAVEVSASVVQSLVDASLDGLQRTPAS